MTKRQLKYAEPARRRARAESRRAPRAYSAASLDVGLTDDEVRTLEASYTPRYDFPGISDEAELEATRSRIPGFALA